jgi:FkbH-like protein
MRQIKLLIYDLDETIWEGTWLYDQTGVKLKEGIPEIIREIDNRGILQSIVSKNVDFDEIMSFLEEKGLRQYFVYPQLSMSPKSQSIRTIVETLGLSRYDDVAFIDDEEFERMEVKMALPEIEIIHLDNIEQLLSLHEFTPKTITTEDKNRRAMVQQDEKRQVQAKAYGKDYQAFLASLHMKATIRPMTEEDIPRVVQLSERTNKWNSKAMIITEYQLLEIIHMPCIGDLSVGDDSSVGCYVCELRDDLGNYGLVGYVLYTELLGSLKIDDMAFSCRVAGRGLGSSLVIHLMQMAVNNKLVAILGNFRPNKYNQQLDGLYKFLGFNEMFVDDEFRQYSWLVNPEVLKYPSWLKVEVKK